MFILHIIKKEIYLYKTLRMHLIWSLIPTNIYIKSWFYIINTIKIKCAI